MNDTNGVPEEIEEEQSERTWADFDDDGQLITGRDCDEEWY